MARRGAPLKLTPALIEQVSSALSIGLPRETAAKYARISYQSFYTWYVRGRREFERMERGDPATTQQEKSESIFLEFFNQIEQAEMDAVVVWQQTINTAMKQGDVGSAWRMLQLRDPKGYNPKPEGEVEGEKERRIYMLPAELVAPAFLAAHRDILARAHTEYVFYGGRGSTKSSFVSLEIVIQLLNNPDTHALVIRQVANTLRDSVYSQIVWAIDQLDDYYPGLKAQFKCTGNPMQITYTPTGQRIFFRGADDPAKLKSIKPEFGAIGILWLEELDQYAGPESVRKVEQSAIRGTSKAFIFKSFNPPPTTANWANKYIKVPKDTQLRHQSDYTQVPAEWLGDVFIREADHLKETNPDAYAHEYMGNPTATGGLVFNNVDLREITDAEIAEFDHIYQGLDWGYALDPLHWGKMHYDAARQTLYVFDEFRAHGMKNDALAEILMKPVSEGGKDVQPHDLIIADSAEPKSVDDMRAYGLTCRGAEKGANSVRYSISWLQHRVKIVIDPRRCPHTAQEFADYEYSMTKDGEFYSEFPDKNNHAIDMTRYALNTIWRQRGQ